MSWWTYPVLWFGVAYVIAIGLRRFAPDKCPDLRGGYGRTYHHDECLKMHGPLKYHVAYRTVRWALFVAALWPLWLALAPFLVVGFVIVASFVKLSDMGREGEG